MLCTLRQAGTATCNADRGRPGRPRRRAARTPGRSPATRGRARASPSRSTAPSADSWRCTDDARSARALRAPAPAYGAARGRRWSPAVLVLSGCSIYDVPLPGGADTGDNPMKVTVMFRDVLDLVPQSTVKVNDVTVGKVTSVNLKGYVAEVDDRDPERRRPARQRPRPDPPDQPARREVRLARARPQEPGSGKLGEQRRHRPGPHRPQPRGRRGLRRARAAAQRRWRRPAQDDRLGAQQRLRRPRVRGPLGARPRSAIFMGQLDENKGSIVAALENTNRLAVELQQAGRRPSRARWTTSRTRCARSTGSATTWSSCSRR